MDTYTFSEGEQNLALLIRKDSGVVSERTDISARISLIGTPSATQGTDFQITLNTRIDFDPETENAPEVVAVPIPLTVIDDQLPEGQESFSLTVVAAEFAFSAPLLDTFATTEVFINDNDGTYVISLYTPCSCSGNRRLLVTTGTTIMHTSVC